MTERSRNHRGNPRGAVEATVPASRTLLGMRQQAGRLGTRWRRRRSPHRSCRGPARSSELASRPPRPGPGQPAGEGGAVATQHASLLPNHEPMRGGVAVGPAPIAFGAARLRVGVDQRFWGGSSRYAATTIVLMVAVSSSATSTTTIYVPVWRMGSSRWTLRRSMRIPRASRIASAMSWGVTDPNSRPSSPACWGIVRHGPAQQSRALLRALDGVSLRLLGLLLTPRGRGD